MHAVCSNLILVDKQMDFENQNGNGEFKTGKNKLDS